MKHFKNYFMLLAVVGLLMTSCSQEDESTRTDEDTATLSFGPALNDMLKKASAKQALPDCSDDDPSYADITITYGGIQVDLEVEILVDESGFFTAYHDDLEIPVTSGDHVTVILTDFSVYDDDDDLIWMAPLEGSDYEDFVSDALPMTINLQAGRKNYVDVEVLCFDDREVNRYGYQFFDILPQQLHEFCVFANYCVDSGRDYVANYSFDIYYFTGDEPVANPEVVGNSDYAVIHSDKDPITGNTAEDESGAWYADPLCLAIPAPLLGEGGNDVYLYYEATLESWPGNYPSPDPVVVNGYLSWNDIQALLNEDGDSDTVDYLHLFFNCDTEECDPLTDADCDGMTDPGDNCPNLYNPGQENSDGDAWGDACDLCPDQVTEVNVECPDECDRTVDSDCDGYNNPEDNCPNEYNPDQTDSDGDGFGDVCDLCPDISSDENLECPAIPGNDCETAFMFGDQELNELDYPGNNWGWGIAFDSDGNFEGDYDIDSNTWEFPLYAGAGQNDTDRGDQAGIVRVSLEGDDVQVQVILDSGVSVEESHIWFSEGGWPENRAPGQLNHQYNAAESDDMHTYSYSGDGSFYLIVHAVVCGDFD